MNSIIYANLATFCILFLYFLFQEYSEKMITLNGLRLLLKIRKAQQYEDGNVYINLKKGIIITSIWNNGVLEKTRPRIVFYIKDKEKFKKSLYQLEKYEWISFVQDLNEEKIYTANHQSWHLLQIVGWCFLKSILIPVIVSVLTTLIVLMLEKVI